MAKDRYRYFRVEARELLEQLAKGVLDLEKGNAGAELVMRLLRFAHTLKGAARVVKQVEIADLIHSVEDALAPHRDGEQPVPREQVDSLLGMLDMITAKLAQLPVADNADTAPKQIKDAAARIVRADVAEVDILLEGLGEIGSEMAGMRRAIASVERIRDMAALFNQPLAPAPDKLRRIAQEIHRLSVVAERNLADGVARIDRELHQARDAAERLRLIPVASIFNTLERTARDAAHSMGKQVSFEAKGSDVRIDCEVLDAVQSALVQLVRNAVAHGIETETERKAVGKPAVGQVRIEVEQRGYRAWFRCMDDGRGVDLEAVRRVAGKRGASHADTQQLTAAELLVILLQGGITTASVVTELSGRGVGLDVVREAMRALNGEVIADTTPGSGTVIELRAPLSLASLDVLMVEADGQVAALPIDAVKGTLRIAIEDVIHTADGDAILHEGTIIPFVPMVFGVQPKPVYSRSPHAMTAVIVTSAADRTMTAIAVTRLRGIDTIVLRPLPLLAQADPIVLGMHLDTEGNPSIVLDPEELAAGLRRRRPHAPSQPRATDPILIIDDSLTTRMLESSILESAGFEVALAASAEEGLAMAKQRRYALFLVDVEMPGMNGFDFIEQTRADPVLSNVPCILVTSCNSDEDRRRGKAAGASDHIIKNEFDQVHFLRRVTELVQR